MIAILGDLHAGEREGNALTMKQQLDWLVSVFIPYLIENKIKTVIQTGDMFDVRRHTNTMVLDEWKKRFFNVLVDLDIKMYTIIGNHDMYYKNKVRPNSQTNHLSIYGDNTMIIEDAQTLNFDGKKMLMVPWICEENEERSLELLAEGDADYCLGHFEVKGAKMESGVCTDGLAISTFKQFIHCISGHFHTQGRYDNIQYVGTPYQTSWGDYGVPKGFWTLDTNTDELNFIENGPEWTLFHRISYNEDRNMDAYLKENFEGQYLKVVVENRDNFKKYEAWLLKLENMGAASLTIIEPLLDRDEAESCVSVDGELTIASTEDIITEYIGDVYPEKQDPLNKMMLGLHSEARRLV